MKPSEVFDDKFVLGEKKGKERNIHLLRIAMDAIYQTFITDTEQAKCRGQVIQAINALSLLDNGTNLIKEFEPRATDKP